MITKLQRYFILILGVVLTLTVWGNDLIPQYMQNAETNSVYKDSAGLYKMSPRMDPKLYSAVFNANMAKIMEHVQWDSTTVDPGFSIDNPAPMVDPVFLIDNPAPGVWTDFEFKGSSNNFTDSGIQETPERIAKFYWYHSPNPSITNYPAQSYPPGDPPSVYFTSTGAGYDVREWVQQVNSPHNSIHSMVTQPSTTSAVGGWIIIVRGLNLSKDELAALTWSYVLMDGMGHEYVMPGEALMLWRPAYPVDYVKPGQGPNIPQQAQ